MGDRAQFSVLIIGCGAIAGGYDVADKDGPHILTHAKAFQHHPGFTLTGCLDQNFAVAEKFAETWDIPHSYADLEQAFAAGGFDIVSICSSTPTHEAYLRHLQGRGVKLIFCEKPITDKLSTAREMADLYSRGLAVNYIRRFDPEIRRLARDIAGDKYGALLSGEASYNKGLYNNGSHMVDLLHLLLGPLKVVSASDVLQDFWQNDPTVSAVVSAAAGQEIIISGGDVREGMVFDLMLDFEQAQVTLTDFSHRIVVRSNGEDGHLEYETSLDQGMLTAASHIYDHLTTGVPLYSTADTAVQALEICQDIQEKAGWYGGKK